MLTVRDRYVYILEVLYCPFGGDRAQSFTHATLWVPGIGSYQSPKAPKKYNASHQLFQDGRGKARNEQDILIFSPCSRLLVLHTSVRHY